MDILLRSSFEKKSTPEKASPQSVHQDEETSPKVLAKSYTVQVNAEVERSPKIPSFRDYSPRNQPYSRQSAGFGRDAKEESKSEIAKSLPTEKFKEKKSEIASDQSPTEKFK